jgi:archaellum component FlaG (FlaF/FlaG flagellin family)
MKLFRLTMLSTLIAASVVGCFTRSTVKALSQLKDDPSTLHINVSGWGTVVDVTRSNPNTNQTVTVDGNKVVIGKKQGK